MFRRKLKSLGYHSPEQLDVKDPEQFKNLVVWLEDQKIRHYQIKDRQDLRETSGEKWRISLQKYLTDLECPFAGKVDADTISEWLIGYAVCCEYDGLREEDSTLRCGIHRQTQEAPTSFTEVDFSRLSIDPCDADLIKGTSLLADLLKVAPHPNVGILLEAVCTMIEERLTTEGKDSPPQSVKRKAPSLKISAKECGFSFGDPVLNEAAKALRLLHIRELRQLQTEVNRLIMNVQSLTADPKTDHKLGKVGH